jgi:hypothetical protein
MRRLSIPSLVAVTAAATLLAMSIAQAQDSSRAKRERSWSNQSSQGWQNSRGSYPHIIMGGRDMGTDPDPNIRANIMRDTGMAYGGER